MRRLLLGFALVVLAACKRQPTAASGADAAAAVEVPPAAPAPPPRAWMPTEGTEGTTAPAPQATRSSLIAEDLGVPPTSTRLSVHLVDSTDSVKSDLTGVALASLGPAPDTLSIHVFAANTRPTPSCSQIGTLPSLERGGLASLTIARFAGAVGNYEVSSIGAMLARNGGNDLEFVAATLASTVIQIRTYDGKKVAAEIVRTASRSESRVFGTIVAKLCPK